MAYIAPRIIGILRLKPSILFQISLETWAEALPIATKIAAIANEIQSPKLALTPRRLKNRRQQFDELVVLLINNQQHIATWERGKPPLLLRLSEGVWRLLSHKSYVMENTLSLYKSVDHAVDWAERCSMNRSIEHSASRLVSSLKKTGSSLIDSLSLFRDDENVILFLLRNSRTLDKALALCPKSPTVFKILGKLFPEGTTALEKHLRDRFHRRGFPEVVPTIQALLTDLHSSSPCLANTYAN